VAGPAVADEVDNDVACERGAIGGRHARHPVDRVRIVAVDVQDGSLDQLGDIGREAGGAAFLGAGGEAHLVVDDDVDRAADVERREPGELQHLGHETLAGEARVGMQEQGHGRAPATRSKVELLGARPPLRDDGSELQVRGVRAH
jgi:hypothetical protein